MPEYFLYPLQTADILLPLFNPTSCAASAVVSYTFKLFKQITFLPLFLEPPLGAYTPAFSLMSK